MTESRQEREQGFLTKLQHKVGAAESADFTIVCGGEEHHVHKLVLSIHSGYFDTLFKSGYKEALQNRIELAEDPKFAVQCMIEYFYKFDYDLSNVEFPSAAGDPMDWSLNDISASPDAPIRTQIEAHAKVYTLADKYDIPSLKTLAKTMFKHWAIELVCTQDTASAVRDFLNVVPFVYTYTAPTDMGLRAGVVHAWRREAKKVNAFLGDKKLRELVGMFPDLGTDLINGLVDRTERSVVNVHMPSPKATASAGANVGASTTPGTFPALAQMPPLSSPGQVQGFDMLSNLLAMPFPASPRGRGSNMPRGGSTARGSRGGSGAGAGGVRGARGARGWAPGGQ